MWSNLYVSTTSKLVEQLHSSLTEAAEDEVEVPASVALP